MDAAQPALDAAESPEDTGCFLIAPLPPNEAERLKVLHSYGVLDSAAEEVFDDLTRIAALCCEVPIAVISLVDRDRQWFKARIGVEATGTHRNLSFCAHAILEPEEVMIVPDARLDPRFAGHPAVTAAPGIVFYAAAPLVAPSGEAIGTLCIADHSSRAMTAAQAEILRGLAAQAMAQLEMRRSIMQQEVTLETQSRYLSQLERHQLELEQENATDPLTSLGNRRAFQDRLETEMLRARRYGTGLALMIIDVDFFKRYNDSFGHPAGDAVLRQLAGVMKRTCRGYDFVARVGGEEFAVILPDTTEESALAIAERLRRNVQREHWANRPVTVSVGVAVASTAIDGHQLTERADIALYRSKRDGRNRVTISGSGEVD